MAEAISNLAQQNSKNLPSQTERNPRENVSAMFLRSGKILEEKSEAEDETHENRKNEGVTVPEPRARSENRGCGPEPRARFDNRGCGFAPVIADSSENAQEEEEPYDDQGAFKLRQDNYVRPNFPPLYSEKPPAPFLKP